ncbi:MAG: hypothetical protein HKO66_16355 [Saprospiraceae bacterium]|nr:hypothetical protein [Bacteroidia bacterium]NNE13448.1 hypothetical protein [Saprospiraceae bacterium]NNL93817.1 hypothetical protein [Saprospiraceae bacterium]
MIKLFVLGGLLYAAYRIYMPKSLDSSEKDAIEDNETEYTDYEEVD